MRLSTIKLAGFKSFVDPTTIHLPGNLVGIVGPNGCGKSNVIDAVRWVMGEMSARSLRGESMADVIFSGSGSRKPVSQASVELVFDNSDASLGGYYALYAGIAIKRVVSRDGQSSYYLNGSRCRRRDIVDIFLGTGLGPHSYAIIEQNMIARLVEAKPDELRVFLEEAAGISKYKERRRETETRIRHTRDNLQRITDQCGELERQIERLRRQAGAAEKYKRLKSAARQLQAEQLALRWQAAAIDVERQRRAISEDETALEGGLATQRSIEAGLATQRIRQGDANDAFNFAQGHFYRLGADVSHAEASLRSALQKRAEQQQVLAATGHDSNGVQDKLTSAGVVVASLEAQLERSVEESTYLLVIERESRTVVESVEHEMHVAQAEWETFQQKHAVASQAAELERARVSHCDQQLQPLEQRFTRLHTEQKNIAPELLACEISTHKTTLAGEANQLAALRESIEASRQRLTELRAQTESVSRALDGLRESFEQGRGRASSLRVLQQAALGQDQNGGATWLDVQGLRGALRLAQTLTVAIGWERAVECVLDFHLEAICVARVQDVALLLEDWRGKGCVFIESSAIGDKDTASLPSSGSGGHQVRVPLLGKVHSRLAIETLFAGIYAVDTLAQAIALADGLDAHESVVTRSGIWLGKHWLRVAGADDKKAGVLARENEIRALDNELRYREEKLASTRQRLDAHRKELVGLEHSCDQTQRTENETQQRCTTLHVRINGLRIRHEQAQARKIHIEHEMTELTNQIVLTKNARTIAATQLAVTLSTAEAMDRQRSGYLRVRDESRVALDRLRTANRMHNDAAHAAALRTEAVRGTLATTRQNMSVLTERAHHLLKLGDQLRAALGDGEAPLHALQSALGSILETRQKVEQDLTAARNSLAEREHALRQLEQQRHAAEHAVDRARHMLETARLLGQSHDARCAALEEQIQHGGFALQSLLESAGVGVEIPEQGGDHINEGGKSSAGVVFPGPESVPAEQIWQEKIDEIARRIDRLGPVNLAAIAEFDEQSRRKSYLDGQCADLHSALSTLEEAMRKIDRKTRELFRETFDRVNSGLQRMFPCLFDGGSAYLELSGGDMLNTGITIMARPPGKRNTTIHLLSGGEKALTAVAMVFAMFELNPAPFCMLDEVDASLDEANVGRFCRLVKEISHRIPFIYITHNKATMEMAHQLAGITMHEQGVSRLVTVDMNQAVALISK